MTLLVGGFHGIATNFSLREVQNIALNEKGQ